MTTKKIQMKEKIKLKRSEKKDSKYQLILTHKFFVKALIKIKNV